MGTKEKRDRWTIYNREQGYFYFTTLHNREQRVRCWRIHFTTKECRGQKKKQGQVDNIENSRQEEKGIFASEQQQKFWPGIQQILTRYEKGILTRYSLLNSNSENASWRSSQESSKAVRIGSLEGDMVNLEDWSTLKRIAFSSTRCGPRKPNRLTLKDKIGSLEDDMVNLEDWNLVVWLGQLWRQLLGLANTEELFFIYIWVIWELYEEELTLLESNIREGVTLLEWYDYENEKLTLLESDLRVKYWEWYGGYMKNIWKWYEEGVTLLESDIREGAARAR